MLVPHNDKLTDSRPAVNLGRQFDVRKSGPIGSRLGWRLFGGASCYAFSAAAQPSPQASTWEMLAADAELRAEIQ